MGGFASSHSGGAQFLMLDSSVRFISENINSEELQQLADRADGGNPVNF